MSGVICIQCNDCQTLLIAQYSCPGHKTETSYCESLKINICILLFVAETVNQSMQKITTATFVYNPGRGSQSLSGKNWECQYGWFNQQTCESKFLYYRRFSQFTQINVDINL